MGNLHKNIQLMLQFLQGPFLVLHFSYIVGKRGHTPPPFSRSTPPPFLRFPFSRNPRCPHLSQVYGENRERNRKLLLETVTYIAIKESHLHNYNKQQAWRERKGRRMVTTCLLLSKSSGQPKVIKKITFQLHSVLLAMQQ